MSRDVEVLRDDGGGHGTMLIRFSPKRAYRLYLDGTATGAELKADMDMISAAISALEREERRDRRRQLGPPPAPEDVEAHVRRMAKAEESLSSGPGRLDENEAPPRCQAPSRYVPGRTCLNVLPCERHPAPKSSSDSMEERIRALEAHLSQIQRLAQGAADRIVTAEALRLGMRQIAARADSALHPHASWCRGDHSEGPCLADPMEVDRE